MEQTPKDKRRLSSARRVVIEIALLMFISYSVQLMAEFIAVGEQTKSIGFALYDISTVPNVLLALFSALIGCAVIEYLRKTVL